MKIPGRSDMEEMTRLTREGRLDEAMDILQGRHRPAPDAPREPEDRPAPDHAARRGDEREADANASADASNGSSNSLFGSLGSLSGLTERFSELRDRLPSGLNSPFESGSEPEVPVPDGARFERGTFDLENSSRRYRLYIPANRPAGPMAMIVMLHGCTQTPEDFALGTAMNDLAERHGFAVLYPGQSRRANLQRCWNWFSSSDQTAERGENALLAQMTRHVAHEEGIDRDRIFVAGLSAGGAAAALLARNHPALFSAAGIHSGLAAGAATDLPAAMAAMRSGAAGSSQERAFRTIIFHGDRDETVATVNGRQVAEQALGGRKLHLSSETVSEGGRDATRHRWIDAEGAVQVEHWVIHGGGHVWSGGSAAGSYTDPDGPDASAAMVAFFLEGGR